MLKVLQRKVTNETFVVANEIKVHVCRGIDIRNSGNLTYFECERVLAAELCRK